MRMLKRNLKPFYYALYLGKTPLVDGEGNDTGEYTVNYGTKTLAYANISQASGSISSMWYGMAEGYDKTLILDKDIPLTEESRLWIDDTTADEGDYRVKLIRKSLTTTSVLVRKIKP